MKVTIKYCASWDYLPDASKVEEEITSKFNDITVKLIAGRGGIFDIKLDDKLIFSKKDIRRFPFMDEITKIIEKRIG